MITIPKSERANFVSRVSGNAKLFGLNAEDYLRKIWYHEAASRLGEYIALIMLDELLSLVQEPTKPSSTRRLNMRCSQCGNHMVDSHTTVTTIRDHMVFVTESIPCLECSVCGHIAIKQDVARTLETISFGRPIPSTTYRAWVFKWGEPVTEIVPFPEAKTRDLVLSINVSGT